MFNKIKALVVSKVKTLFATEPLVAVNAVAVLIVGIQQAVADQLNPGDGWVAIVWIATVYTARRYVSPAES